MRECLMVLRLAETSHLYGFEILTDDVPEKNGIEGAGKSDSEMFGSPLLVD